MPPAPAFSSSPSPRLASYSSPLLDGSGRLDLFHQVVVPVALGDEDNLGIVFLLPHVAGAIGDTSALSAVFGGC